MDSWSDVRAYWKSAAGRAHVRARWTVGALLATVFLCAAEIFVEQTTSPLSTPALMGHMAELAMVAITGIAFLMWLSSTIRVAAAMSPTAIKWTPSRAVWSFIVPFISLYWPYLVVRDLHDQLAPDAVPEPAPRQRFDGAGGYRSIAVERPPPPRTLPHASIGLWWALFLAERVMPVYFSPAHGIAIAAGVLAVLVVRAVDGRLEERERRLLNASDEELESWGLP